MSSTTLRKKHFQRRTVDLTANYILPLFLPDARAGVAYSQQLATHDGVAPFTYTVTNGAIPAGVTLSSSGLLSGTPTESGSFNFTVTSDDSDIPVDTTDQVFTLLVAVPIITLVPSSLPGATAGVPYSQLVTASGGNTPYTYTLN